MSETPEILRQLARKRTSGETCELCGQEIPAEHTHLADPESRQLLCSCRACALLFSRRADTRYHLVPDRVRVLENFAITEELWESLLIPVNLAYFFFHSPANKIVALYPGPAGSTESLLTLDAWQELVEANPALADMEPDVEGLLLNRVGDGREYFIAPIDRFYELVGLIKTGWTGLSGGTDVWRDVAGFFDRLRRQGERVTA